MWKSRSILLVLAVTAAFTSSCIFDPEKTEKPIIPPPPWPDLSLKEDVLYYVQRAYSDRNSNRYEQVLDAGFTNFVADGDVGGGGQVPVPVSWDVEEEKSITRNLFSKSVVSGIEGKPLPLVKKIDMNVEYEEGVTWVAQVPPSAPDETWYTATAFYTFEILVAIPGFEDKTYYPPGSSKAAFTVRNNGTDDNPVWKLVEFRDLGGGS